MQWKHGFARMTARCLAFCEGVSGVGKRERLEELAVVAAEGVAQCTGVTREDATPGLERLL